MRFLTLVLLFSATRLEAQRWNDAETISLVERAVLRRSRTEADSTLRSYRASGHGLVTFLAEIGSDPLAPGRLLKGDELRVVVYWQRPDRSKQIIRGWRDSTFFPTAISYHRDHLGVVTDDFGPRIRIGNGDEVRDVVHPLSPEGPAGYDYAIRDTVTIRTPDGRLTLIAVDTRPKDSRQPAVVGSLFLEAERALLVRSELTFTPAAYRDPDLEDITVRLERALVDGRYWLPFHQEIEIRRRVAALDFPLRSVIRGRWEIGDYEINAEIGDSALRGPTFGGLRRPGGVGPWPVPLARLVDSSLVPADRSLLADLREKAVALARTRTLDGLPRTSLRVGSISEVARVNRVQGLALGTGLTARAGLGLDRAALGIGIGTSDGRVTGSLELERRIGSVRLATQASRQVTDLSDLPVASGVVASLAAQETGRDYGDYLLLERLAVSADRPVGREATFRLDLAREWAWSVANAATSARGAYRPNPPLGNGGSWIGRAEWHQAGRTAAGSSWQGRLAVEFGAGRADYTRWVASGETSQPLMGGELALRGLAGFGTRGMPARRTFVLGGRVTLPGEAFRAFGGRRAVWGSAVWLFPVPAPSLPLGWFGRTPRDAWIGPLVAAGWAGGSVAGLPWQPAGVRPIVGIAAELFARTVRIEFAQALRGGRGPGITIDLTRQWWGVL
jgi:hypothetical protein